jgi:hypothetical protein
MKAIKGNQDLGKPRKRTKGASVDKVLSAPKNRSAVTVTATSGAEMDDAVARTLTRPEVCAAAVIEAWSGGAHDVNALIAALSAQVDAVNTGQMGRAEAMLIAQAHTLDAISANLFRRAMNQTMLHQWETYMRMGMKAQSQCRATLQALADLKNPRPFAFVKQANIAHGHQQVNNATIPSSTRTGAHAGENQFQQSKLLEDGRDGGTYVDTGAAAAAARGNTALETVGTVNRTKERRRQGKG